MAMAFRPSGFLASVAILLAAAPGGAWAAAAQAAQPLGFEIGVRGWRSDLTFGGHVDGESLPGSGLDNGTFGLDGGQLVPVPYVRLGGLGNYLLVDYFQRKYDGSTTLEADLAMSGTLFAAGTAVKTHLDLQIVSGYYNYALTDPNGSFQAGILAGVKYCRIESGVGSDAASASMRMVVPAPVAGTLIRLTLMDGLEITGQMDGLQLPESIIGTKVVVFEWMVEVAAKMGYVTAGIGYSYSKCAFTANGGKSDEMEFDMKIDGPYVVVALVF
jgi:hypothetical protein